MKKFFKLSKKTSDFPIPLYKHNKQNSDLIFMILSDIYPNKKIKQFITNINQCLTNNLTNVNQYLTDTEKYVGKGIGYIV